MKKINHLMVACFAVGLNSMSFAQNTWDGSSTPTITTNGSIGIGTTPSSAYRFMINNTTTGSGIYQTTNLGLNGSQYGIYNFLNTGTGAGTKYGVFNSTVTSTSSNTYGTYSVTSVGGTGTKYGISANVNGSGTGIGYGVYSSVSGSASVKYGFYSTVSNTGANNSSTDATAFGVYSIGTGADSRAGYFRGDVEVNQGSTIYSSSNGSKTLFFNHNTAGDNIMSIAFNQTNNQYDWGWSKSLQLNRAGEMIKRFDGTGKVFSVFRFDLNQDVFRVYGDGKVFATEVNVLLASNFPDYVFKSDYKLMPLAEVGSYIKSNGHLPNVPAAAEVEKEGLNVGQMTTVLVEKVEELTLYLLEQQTLIKQQQVEIEALKTELQKINK